MLPSVGYAARPMPVHPQLLTQLDAIDSDLRGRLDRAGFDRARFLGLAGTLGEGDAATRRRTRNCVKGEVRGPTKEEVVVPPARGSTEHTRLSSVGEAALARGELAFCTMAGGMAT